MFIGATYTAKCNTSSKLHMKLSERSVSIQQKVILACFPWFGNMQVCYCNAERLSGLRAADLQVAQSFFKDSMPLYIQKTSCARFWMLWLFTVVKSLRS